MNPIDPNGPDPSERGLGLRRMDVEAYQSVQIIRAAPIALPSSVDISVDAPPPGSQGLQGSCVGWAVAYTVKTYHERIERGWPLANDRHVMSPAYVYNQIKVPGGGAYYADAFTLLADQGVSSWAAMPYDPLDDRTQPSNRARAEAANYRIADWGTVRRTTHAVFVQEVKRHLAAGDPVLIAVPVYPDFDDLSESNPVYDDDGGTSRGFHAVVIVGYDDSRSAFKIANSWGTEWGIGGYGWIAYGAGERLIVSAYVTKDVVASPDDEQPEAASEPDPRDGATGVAVNTVLRWTLNALTTSFDVYLGTDRDLTAADFRGNVQRAEFITPRLSPGSVYYWRVDARGVGGITQGSVWTFTTASVHERPGKAVNPRPADGTTGVVQNTELRWDRARHTTSYDVYLGIDPVLAASDLQGTQATRTYHPSGLRAGTRYYWRIDTKNGQGTTTGDVWTFTTAQAREQDTSPVLPSIGDKTYPVGDFVNERLPAATGGNGRLTYSLTPSIPGLTFDAGTRRLSGTPRQAGTYHVRYRVQDEDEDADSQSFTVTVDDVQPVVDPAGPVWRRTGFVVGSGNSVQDVEWNGSRYVAVTCTGHIWHSEDGFTWRATYNPLGYGEQCLTNIAWNGSRFVAVGYGGIAYSADGITWNTALSRGYFNGVTSNGSRFVAVGELDYGEGKDHITSVWHSDDGVRWSEAPFHVAGWLAEVTSNGTRFVATGARLVPEKDEFEAALWHSTDGVVWTRAVEYPSHRGMVRALAGGDNIFVASYHVGYYVPAPFTPVKTPFLYSSDGVSWRSGTISPGAGLDGMMWNGERFIGWMSDSTTGREGGYIYHSQDGITWDQATIEAPDREFRWVREIAGDSTRLIAVVNFGEIMTSP